MCIIEAHSIKTENPRERIKRDENGTLLSLGTFKLHLENELCK